MYCNICRIKKSLPVSNISHDTSTGNVGINMESSNLYICKKKDTKLNKKQKQECDEKSKQYACKNSLGDHWNAIDWFVWGQIQHILKDNNKVLPLTQVDTLPTGSPERGVTSKTGLPYSPRSVFKSFECYRQFLKLRKVY